MDEEGESEALDAKLNLLSNVDIKALEWTRFTLESGEEDTNDETASCNE